MKPNPAEICKQIGDLAKQLADALKQPTKNPYGIARYPTAFGIWTLIVMEKGGWNATSEMLDVLAQEYAALGLDDPQFWRLPVSRVAPVLRVDVTMYRKDDSSWPSTS